MDNRLQQNFQEIFSIYFSLKVTSHVIKMDKIACGDGTRKYIGRKLFKLDLCECTFEKFFFEKSVSTVNCFLEDLICLFSSISHSLFNVILKIVSNSEATVKDTGRLNVLSSFPPCYSQSHSHSLALKVHKIEIFFGFDFEICIISLLVM